jgi:hypothetical protein
MMTYALVNAARTEIIRVGGRPDWLVDGAPASDAVLAAGGFQVDETGAPVLHDEGEPILATGLDGWLRVVQADVVGSDDLLNTLSWNDQVDWVIEQDRVIQTYTITSRSLIEVKSSSATLIDSMADSARGNFVTQGGPGQALEYDETRREIDAWQATNDPDIEDFPMLRAEYRARKIAEPSITVAQVVADSAQEVAIWRVAGSAIKEIRRTGKVAIEISETPARIRQIVDWASAAFSSAAMTGTFEALS